MYCYYKRVQSLIVLVLPLVLRGSEAQGQGLRGKEETRLINQTSLN
jgi:hypothetical protein